VICAPKAPGLSSFGFIFRDLRRKDDFEKKIRNIFEVKKELKDLRFDYVRRMKKLWE